jgi:hypothetical protein
MLLSEHDFEEATRRIAYEMYHFRSLVQIYRDRRIGVGLWRQLASQSLLLHLRILIEFFYWANVKLQDVTIRDFLERTDFTFPFELYSCAPLVIKPVSRTANRPDSMSLKLVKEALDQRLVHFGRGRWTGYHPGLEDYALCFDDLEHRIIAFRAALPDHLKDAFDGRVSEFYERDARVSSPITKAPSVAW